MCFLCLWDKLLDVIEYWCEKLFQHSGYQCDTAYNTGIKCEGIEKNPQYNV